MVSTESEIDTISVFFYNFYCTSSPLNLANRIGKQHVGPGRPGNKVGRFFYSVDVSSDTP